MRTRKSLNRNKSEVSRLLSGKVAARPQAIARLQAAIKTLEEEKKEAAEIISRAKQASKKIGLRKFAAQAEIDPANLSNIFTGKRRISIEIIAKLQSALITIDN